jgi:hypothetical protein
MLEGAELCTVTADMPLEKFDDFKAAWDAVKQHLHPVEVVDPADEIPF